MEAEAVLYGTRLEQMCSFYRGCFARPQAGRHDGEVPFAGQEDAIAGEQLG